MMHIEIEDIARITHEANRGYQHFLDEVVSPCWDEAPEHLRASVRDGVAAALAGTDPEKSHQNWIKFKLADGWVYGPVKDFEAKTHPCLLDYADLPLEQRMKDELFLAIIGALTGS